MAAQEDEDESPGPEDTAAAEEEKVSDEAN